MSAPASGKELTSRASMSAMSVTSALSPSPSSERVRVAPVADRRLVVVAEVEAAQPRHPLRLAAGDLVERVLHLRGELVVDQLAEVPLEQRDHGERQEGGHQRGALLEHVAAVQDRADDARVGGRPADLPVLQLLDQRGLGVAGRRPGGVLGRGRAAARRAGRPRPAAGSRRSRSSRSAGVVGGLDVGPQEAVEV